VAKDAFLCVFYIMFLFHVKFLFGLVCQALTILLQLVLVSIQFSQEFPYLSVEVHQLEGTIQDPVSC